MSEVSTISVSRQLSAIMFADIAGYTKLMQDNETNAKKIRDTHRESLENRVREFHGEIVQYYGDGTLTIFRSTIDAVSCAVRVQQDSIIARPTVPLRIGLHTGDIVRDDEGIYGDGVNIAARIQSVSSVGSVMVSDKVFDDVKNQQSLPTVSMGHFEFKNVKLPVEVFAVDMPKLKVPKPGSLGGKIKEKQKRIAVLPFVNMSTDPENEYFSDGITEEIISALTRIDGLLVTSRTSSFTFKGKNLPIPDISSSLGVSHILEGSVRKAGQKVRIKVQLTNGADGYEIWSDSFDRSIEDIFEVQDEISRTVAIKLRKMLSLDETEQVIVEDSVMNIEAHNHYLKGLFYMYKWSHGYIEKAVLQFKKALELDGNYLAPRATLATCYSRMGLVGSVQPSEAYEKVMSLANEVLQVEPDNEEAHIAVSLMAFFYQWDFDLGKKHAQMALEKNPNSIQGHVQNSLYELLYGRIDVGYEMLQKSLMVDPLSATTIRTIGDNRYLAGDYDSAIKFYEEALEIDPQYIAAYEFIGWAKMMKGEIDEAIDIYNDLNEETVFAVNTSTQLGYAYALKGEFDTARKYLDDLNAKKAKGNWAVLDLDYAILYTGLGELELAFKHLEGAIDARIGSMIMLHLSPIWKPLHGDDRFADIIKQIGLPAMNQGLD